MVNFRPVLFVIGLVLSKIALFMYVPTLVAFLAAPQAFGIRTSGSYHPSGGVYLFKRRSNDAL